MKLTNSYSRVYADLDRKPGSKGPYFLSGGEKPKKMGLFDAKLTETPYAFLTGRDFGHGTDFGYADTLANARERVEELAADPNGTIWEVDRETGEWHKIR